MVTALNHYLAILGKASHKEISYCEIFTVYVQFAAQMNILSPKWKYVVYKLVLVAVVKAVSM